MVDLPSHTSELPIASAAGRLGVLERDGRFAFAVVAPDRQVLWATPSAERLDPVSVYLEELRRAEAPAAETRERAFREGREYSSFVDVRCAERPATVHVRGVPLQDDEGQVESVLEVVQDVTEPLARRDDRTTQQVLEAAVSTFAHEVNNPLAAIVGSIELLGLDQSPERIRVELENVLLQTRRIARVIDRLRGLLTLRLLERAPDGRRLENAPARPFAGETH